MVSDESGTGLDVPCLQSVNSVSPNLQPVAHFDSLLSTCFVRLFLAIVFGLSLFTGAQNRDKNREQAAAWAGAFRQRQTPSPSSLYGHNPIRRWRKVWPRLHQQGQSGSFCGAPAPVSGGQNGSSFSGFLILLERFCRGGTWSSTAGVL